MHQAVAQPPSGEPQDADALYGVIVSILEDFLQDMDTDFDGDISRQTQLLSDLGFESIDIIQLVVAIEEALGQQDAPFEKLLMHNGRYVEDLSVGQLVDFVAT
ncbi:acyl carrier protein [Abyssibacter profundi]|uniref:Acyl carrier protein n=1 Tax=Abyssibacter profundi TaxID=2182787 RepID=A0A383XQ13_9GAMM|nr:phosphopantetheine-binding protein [Abyssibacter profundi]PWN54717.1 acyl carrier protein [Abyssibacter profundi]